MSEYIEFSDLLSLYHEEFLMSVDTHAGEDPSSATKKSPIQPFMDKKPRKSAIGRYQAQNLKRNHRNASNAEFRQPRSIIQIRLYRFCCSSLPMVFKLR
jgi:hypothetical protein